VHGNPTHAPIATCRQPFRGVGGHALKISVKYTFIFYALGIVDFYVFSIQLVKPYYLLSLIKSYMHPIFKKKGVCTVLPFCLSILRGRSTLQGKKVRRLSESTNESQGSFSFFTFKNSKVVL
jgi:hypothetical protein